MHTAGPWKHYDDSKQSVHRHQIVAMGKTIAHIYCTNGMEEEDASNARLIAAAPELLAAAQAIVKRHDMTNFNRLEAAIAKATGDE